MNDSILKDCRKAVNQAKYSATAERKAKALKLLAELTEAVANLKEVKPKAKAKAKTSKKSKAKSKAKSKDLLNFVDSYAELTKADLIAMLEANNH